MWFMTYMFIFLLYLSYIRHKHKLIPKLTIDIKVNEENMKGLNG